MPWPPENEPEAKLHEALFTLAETRGDEQTIAFLRQELARLSVVSSLTSERRKLLPAPAPSAPAQPDVDADIAVNALKFYAEETNYDTRKIGRDRQSAITKDGGQMARNTLAALAGNEE